MRKGEIVMANDDINHPHPIVFLETISKGSFHSCILSTKPTNGNVLMNPNHFCSHDENYNKYNFEFRNTHLVVSESFIKMEYWIDGQEVIGCLTKEGIEFVESYIKDQPILCRASIKQYKNR